MKKPRAEPGQERPAPESGNPAALDALDRLQESLRARGVDLHRWAEDVDAGRRAAGSERQAEIREAILETSERCAALPDLDGRAADEILGYDERGGFAEGPQGGRRAVPDQLPTVARASRTSTEEP